MRTLPVALALTVLLSTPAAAQTISGTLFRDYNADGTNAAGEPGVAGITVTAYDSTGAVARATGDTR